MQDLVNEPILDVDLVDVPALLFPNYLRRFNRVIERLAGLIAYDDNREEYRHTREGELLVAEIRKLHGLTFIDDSGGGRWHVEGYGLHAGDGVDILLVGGEWMPTRFEVIFRKHPNAMNGRLPRFHIATAGGSSLACFGDGERWSDLLVRRPL